MSVRSLALKEQYRVQLFRWDHVAGSVGGRLYYRYLTTLVTGRAVSIRHLSAGTGSANGVQRLMGMSVGARGVGHGAGVSGGRRLRQAVGSSISRNPYG